MKKFILAIVLTLFLCAVASATTVLDDRIFQVTVSEKQYVAYFSQISPIYEADETGVCYVSQENIVVAIFNYWYKVGEVVRIHGFSDFLLGPNKLTQIIYGIELTEVPFPMPVH